MDILKYLFGPTQMEGLLSILNMLRLFNVTPWEVGCFSFRSLNIYNLLYRRGFEYEISYGGQQLKLVNMQSYAGNPLIQLAFPYWVGEVSSTLPPGRLAVFPIGPFIYKIYYIGEDLKMEYHMGVNSSSWLTCNPMRGTPRFNWLSLTG